MTQIKEQLAYFKNEARSYIYLQRLKEQLEEDLNELWGEMVGVSSPAVKDVIVENAADPYSEKKVRLIEEKDRKQKELDSALLRIRWIDEVLDRIGDDKKRSLIISVLVLGADVERTAFSAGYSRSAFYRMMNSTIKKALFSLKM